ncbi:MAG: hypothetical protein IT458_10460 [Planctomycetes bacterium]|nr:hypothetical protein [Planctomycetota bacterium]
MSLFGTGRKEGLFAILLLLVLALVLHSRRLVPGATPAAPEMGAATHNQEVLLPAMREAGRVLEAGEAPAWNPHSRFGEPFSTSGAPLLYPPFWVFLLQGGERLLGLVMALHAFLACVAMYRFLRGLPLSRYAAFVGGGLHGLGWFLTAQMHRLPEAAAMALLPFALEATWRVLVVRRRLLQSPWLGISLALLFLTGGTSTATLGTLLCGALLLFSLPAVESSDRPRIFLASGLAALAALLLTAPLWLAVLGDGDPHRAVAASDAARMRAEGLVGLVASGPLLGEGLAPRVAQEASPASDPLTLAIYPGTLVLYLLVLGFFRPKRTAFGLFWVLTAGLGLLLSLESGAGDWLNARLGLLPLQPGAAWILVHVAITVMASLVLDGFFEAPTARSFAFKLVAGFAGCFVLLALSAWLAPDPWRRGLAPVFAGTPVAEARALIQDLGRSILPAAVGMAFCSALFLLWRPLGILRFKVVVAVLVLGECVAFGWLGAAPASRESSAALRIGLPSGRAVLVGRGAEEPEQGALRLGDLRVATSAGNRILERSAAFVDLVDDTAVRLGADSVVRPLSGPWLLRGPLLRRAAIDVVVAPDPISVDGFLAMVPAPGGGVPHAGLHAALRNAPAPRVRVGFLVEHAADPEDAAMLLVRHAPTPEIVVLENADRTFAPRRPAQPPRVDVLEERASSLRIRVEMAQGRGYLVLADAIAPGWEAWLDGASVPLLPADLAFRAVAVPEGSHEVLLRYRPTWLTLGLPVLGLGLLLCIGLLILGLTRRR